jgi:hypothetical protein
VTKTVYVVSASISGEKKYVGVWPDLKSRVSFGLFVELLDLMSCFPTD